MWKPIEEMKRPTLSEEEAEFTGNYNIVEQMIKDGQVCIVMGRDVDNITELPEIAYFSYGELFSIIDGAELTTSAYNVFKPIW